MMRGSMQLVVGARSSMLSQEQLWEVWKELVIHHPQVVFQPLFISTSGDLDRTTPLWKVAQSDFFTREIDQQLLQGKIRLAIHSAKDLPSPLPQGLDVVALTKGVDARDSIVMPESMTVHTLPEGAKIGCSSKRRESIIKSLRSDFVPVDIRGTILERLQLLHEQQVDALIMAQAAIIRLRLCVNHHVLSHPTEPGQGRLAIVARSHDVEMKELFSCLNIR